MTFLGIDLLAALCAVLLARQFVHILQLEGYKLRETLAWMRGNVGRWLGQPLSWALGCAAARVLLSVITLIMPLPVFYATMAALFIACLFMGRREKHRAYKKPLVFTARVKRLYAFIAVVAAVVALVLFAIPMPNVVPGSWQQSVRGPDGSMIMLSYPQPLMGIWVYLTPALTPLIVVVAALLAAPLERGIKNYYFRDAQKRLRARKKLIRIGITGSFGKTSVKFILGKLLEQRYSVLVTPSSFNTPMGVTKVIREQLTDGHQVFIAEMGAKHVGDIDELCDLVAPQYGLITSIGKQHLETFGSLDAIIHTKYELIEALPYNGAAFFPDDGGICRDLFEGCHLKKKFLSSLTDEDAYVYVENIEVGPFGSRFTLRNGDKSIACETKLLGRHNIQNIANASALAVHLGVSLPQLAEGIRGLQPVEHRLQIVPTGNGVTVIDDAFNSNPAGAKAAMDVMRAFPERRIVVTPGMVELGAEEEALNRAFGEQMAQSVDIAILIGLKRAQPMLAGLRAKGFDEANIHVVASLDEATTLLGKTMRAGDTVLFENDLPDNYNET